RGEGRGLRAALGDGQGLVLGDAAAERVLLALLGEVLLGGLDDPEGVLLRLGAGAAPRGDAVSPEDAADRIRVLRLDLADVEAELEAGATPRDPDDLVAEGLPGELLAVLRGRERDA